MRNVTIVDSKRETHLSTGVEVFSMKLIIFSFTFTDFDLRAKVILLTKDLTPLLSPGESPCPQQTVIEVKKEEHAQREGKSPHPLTSAELRLL